MATLKTYQVLYRWETGNETTEFTAEFEHYNETTATAKAGKMAREWSIENKATVAILEIEETGEIDRDFLGW